MRRERLPVNLLGAVLLFGIFACSGGTCKKWTACVVGETVEKGKNTIKGVKEGIEKGRKQGESVDGARIVSDFKTLEEKGSVSVHRIEGKRVTLAFSNPGKKPLRVTELKVMVLDKEGFAKEPTGVPAEITIPPDAKDTLSFQSPIPKKQIGHIRIWDKDLPVSGDSKQRDAHP